MWDANRKGEQMKEPCPTCGSRVRVEGKTTQYFVPEENMKERSKEITSILMRITYFGHLQAGELLKIERALVELVLKTREATVKECAEIADRMIRSNEVSFNTAMLAGRETVASHRQSDMETSTTIRNKILSLLNEPKIGEK
jgi:hypothetical protein